MSAATAGASFNCVVTDIHMPGMSGIDLMKRLAAEGSTTPVVLITARSDSNLEAKAAAAGAACLLTEAVRDKSPGQVHRGLREGVA